LWQRAAQPLVHRMAQSADRGWLRPLLRDTQEMDTDVSEAGKSAHKQAAAADKAKRIADKERLLAGRRRERRRAQFGEARRKHIARVKGRIKALVGLSSS
jgi:hypothetical protein